MEEERERWLGTVRDIRADELVEFSSAGEHDQGNLSITENSELLGFLENTISSLGIGHLPVSSVLNPLDLDLPTTHPFFSCETPPKNY